MEIRFLREFIATSCAEGCFCPEDQKEPSRVCVGTTLELESNHDPEGLIKGGDTFEGHRLNNKCAWVDERVFTFTEELFLKP